MSLEDFDILELQDRYLYLMKEYVNLAIEIAPKMDKFGKYRKELQLLAVEFSRRGFTVEDPESLKKLVEAELDKRKQMPNEDEDK
jgi:hypothetical protein